MQSLWTNRKKKMELATLAARALSKLGTPQAASALEAGKKRYNRTIRNACVAALAAAPESPQGKA